MLQEQEPACASDRLAFVTSCLSVPSSQCHGPPVHSRRGSAPDSSLSHQLIGPGDATARATSVYNMDPPSKREALSKQAAYQCTSHDRECGLLFLRPIWVQKLANIKVFVLLLSMLVTLQQALSSGYLNSVITTIEKHYEIPSSLTGIIASFYEIGNMLTVIFVSYLGSRRHGPVWIGCGVMVMGVGSLLFSVPYFITPSYSQSLADGDMSDSGVCRSGGERYRPAGDTGSVMSLPAKLLQNVAASPRLSAHTNLHQLDDNCIEAGPGNLVPVLVFMLAQLLLGAGGSPLFTLGTTYIDDHVTRQSSSFYIGCMYSMVAFGPVLGFLLGAYMLSHHVDALSDHALPTAYNADHSKWVGMWWGGFLVCGVGMFFFGSLFFLFPKTLEREKQRVREREKALAVKKLDSCSVNFADSAAAVGTEESVHSRLLHSQHHHQLQQQQQLQQLRHVSGPAECGDVMVRAGHRRAMSTNVESLRPAAVAAAVPATTAAAAAEAGAGEGGGAGVSRHGAVSSVTFRPGHRRTLSTPTDQELVRRVRAAEFTSHHRLHNSSWRNVSSTSQFPISKGGAVSHSSVRVSFRRAHRRTRSNVSQLSRFSRPESVARLSNYGKDVKDLPKSMWKLICNPIYVVTCLGACMELMIVSGFVVFLPKYLETQFSLGKSEASMFAGGIAIPGACLGVFAGGYILKRLQLRPKGAVQFILIFQLLCLAMYSVFFFVGCDNVKMAGATAPYSISEGGGALSVVNLTASCNHGCRCDPGQVQPVCGVDGLTYFSACHAGCTDLNGQSNYTNCSCIGQLGGSQSVSVVSLATPGPCSRNCSRVLPFMVLLFFMTFVVAITQMPLLMIVLRSVEEEERSFALGMQFVIFRLFAYIPSPIMFGNVIDSTCVLWRSVCGGSGGRCLLYDIEVFRYKYVGICAGLKVLSALIFVFDWLLIRWRYRLDMGRTMTVGDIVNSIVSVDRGYHNADQLEEDDDEYDDAVGPVLIDPQ